MAGLGLRCPFCSTRLQGSHGRERKGRTLRSAGWHFFRASEAAPARVPRVQAACAAGPGPAWFPAAHDSTGAQVRWKSAQEGTRGASALAFTFCRGCRYCACQLRKASIGNAALASAATRQTFPPGLSAGRLRRLRRRGRAPASGEAPAAAAPAVAARWPRRGRHTARCAAGRRGCMPRCSRSPA